MKSKFLFGLIISSGVFLFSVFYQTKTLHASPYFSSWKITNDLWKTLFKVKYGNWRVRFAPRFSPEVKALDGKMIKIQGFLIPLEQKTEHSFFYYRHFLLTNVFTVEKQDPKQLLK